MVELSRTQQQSYSFTYHRPGLEIAVSAVWLPTMETWGMTCRRNRVAVDFERSDDPWADARSMIDDAIQSFDDEKETESEHAE